MQLIQNAVIKPNTRVFVNTDLDVPLEDSKIMDTNRLDNTLKTLAFLKDKGARIIIGGHLGQPCGQVITDLSTTHLKTYFDQQLGADNYELLENLRFDIREEQNDVEYAKELAGLADIYVNENFATSHRKHASIIGIPEWITGYAGFHTQKEVQTLESVLTSPKHPLVTVIAGVKLESKMPVALQLSKIADNVLIGGTLGLAWKTQKNSNNQNSPNNIVFPQDYARDNKDIGPETIAMYVDIIKDANTIVWAGPLGMFESAEFADGTRAIATAISTATKSGALSIVGGGDTISALKQETTLINEMSFISTGGGAMLTFLTEGTLPGLKAIGHLPRLKSTKGENNG